MRQRQPAGGAGRARRVIRKRKKELANSEPYENRTPSSGGCGRTMTIKAGLMGRKPIRQEIKLSDGDRKRLEEIASRPQSLEKHALRAGIILELGSGRGLAETMRRTGTSKPTVWRWWDRFLENGIEGLLRDATRPPGKAPIPEYRVNAVIDRATSPPPPGTSHWTLRALSNAAGGMAISTVGNILRVHGIQPHRIKTFKLFRDPRFQPKVSDVVGLYVDPPDHAVVLSGEGSKRTSASNPRERAQIQALGHRRKAQSADSAHAETNSRGYRRNNITSLLEGFDIAAGKVIGQTVGRRRSKEFLAFLDQVAEGIGPGVPAHVIQDNIASNKSAEIHKWLKERPDWTLHFTPTPTPASWMKAVERFFSRLLRQRLGNTVFDSLDDFVAAVEGYVKQDSTSFVQPFRWNRIRKDVLQMQDGENPDSQKVGSNNLPNPQAAPA